MFNEMLNSLRMIDALYDCDFAESYKEAQRKAARESDGKDWFNAFVDSFEREDEEDDITTDKVENIVGELLQERLVGFSFIDKFAVTVEDGTLTVEFTINDRLSSKDIPKFLEFVTYRIYDDIVTTVNTLYEKEVIDHVHVKSDTVEKKKPCKAAADNAADENVKRLQKQVSLLMQQLCELREATAKPAPSAAKEKPVVKKEASSKKTPIKTKNE